MKDTAQGLIYIASSSQQEYFYALNNVSILFQQNLGALFLKGVVYQIFVTWLPILDVNISEPGHFSEKRSH